MILALAILTGALAILGELARRGMRNARVAQDQTVAQLLCESKMAEILAASGTLPDVVQDSPLDENVADPSGSRWLCSVAVDATDQDGLVAVRVTVTQDLSPEKRPVEFSLVRWMLDPTADIADEMSDDSTQGGSP